jgi:hypothetical protein
MQDDKVFANGFIFKRNDNAPDWAIGKVSIKVDEFEEFIKEHQSRGWLNLEVKRSKGGKFYAELDTFEPQGQAAQNTAPSDVKTTDLPF